MTLRCADLFAGMGGTALGATQAGFDVVVSANHWPAAVEVHRKNHPFAEHYTQDLQQANFLDWPDFDVLLASPACLPGDTPVVLANGVLKCAEDVVVGDMVLTHQGRARRSPGGCANTSSCTSTDVGRRGTDGLRPERNEP